MNKWQYFIREKRDGKRSRHVKMGSGKTIENTFESLKENEVLKREHLNDETKIDILVSINPREWVREDN